MYTHLIKKILISAQLRRVPFMISLVFSGIVATLLLCMSGSMLNAQARFVEPPREVNLTNYRTVEQCLAMVDRLESKWQNLEPLYDTMPPGFSDRMILWPSNIVESAQKCSAQWQASTAPLKDLWLLGQLFLVADRKSDLSTLLSRRIAEATTNEDSLKRMIADSALELYARARPVYFHEIDSLVTYMIALPDTIISKEDKIDRLWLLRALAVALEIEPAVAMRAAAMADSLFTRLSDEERRTPWYADPRMNTADRAKSNSFFLHFRERMDSLSIGTAAYVNLVNHQQTVLFNAIDPTQDRRFDVGASSPRIDGDFWFPVKPTISRPTAGKISLVIPMSVCLGPEDDPVNSYGCLGKFAMVKRIHKQFPNIEITVLANQEGRAILQEPGSAADEAEDMRRWLLEGLNLPITLVVEKADFIRLEMPDNRLINTRWTLDLMLSWGCQVGVDNVLRCPEVAFLVDESGIILQRFNTRWQRGVEEGRLLRMLEAISHRNP